MSCVSLAENLFRGDTWYSMDKEENGKVLLQQMKKMEMSTRRLIELTERTQYRITQVNGQRTYGPPPDWIGLPPSKDCEVFVGRIPRDCFEDELIPVLEMAGFIYEFRLMMDFSGSNRGFGFALYSKPSEARQAIETLNQYEIRRGCTLGIVKSMNNCKLFIGGLDMDVFEEELLTTLKFLTPDVFRVTIHHSKASSTFQRQKKYALVEYETHRAAAMARRILVPQKTRFRGTRVVVDWANPFGEELKWEKKSFQANGSKSREKRNSAELKNKGDFKLTNNNHNGFSSLQARMGAAEDTTSNLFSDRNTNEGFCDNFLEGIKNDQMVQINIASPNFTRSEPLNADLNNLNSLAVGSANFTQNVGHFILIPQGIVPANNFAVQRIMFNASQGQTFGGYQHIHPIQFANLAKEPLIIGDNRFDPTLDLLCKQLSAI